MTTRYKQLDYPNLHKHISDEDGMWVLYDDYAAELATLRAENERLLEKLGVVASYDWNNADWVRDFAKEALK